MADAGKVAILPRGVWNAETVYEPLDLVYYNNNSFVALKESVGVTPVDGDTWMLSLSGISQETIDAILNGTQQVGDSAKLGGKDASEYAEKTQLFGSTRSYANLDFNNLYSTAIYTNGSKPSAVGASNYPVDTTGTLTVFGGDTVSQRYVTYNGVVFERSYLKGVGWSSWGGYLPLSGGKLTSANAQILQFNRTGESARTLVIDFLVNNVRQGMLGFDGVNKPIFRDTNSNYCELLHTGNKPTGTYTGNGDATERRIKVGGIGKVVYVFNTRGLAIVTTGGTAVFPNGGEFTWISATTLDSSTMEIVLKTDNANLNGSNLAFNYQVA